MVEIGTSNFYISEEDLSVSPSTTEGVASHCSNLNNTDNQNKQEVKQMTISIETIQNKINSINSKKQKVAKLTSEIEMLTKEVADKVELLDNLENEIDNQISEKTKELESLKEISEHLNEGNNTPDTEDIDKTDNKEIEQLENIYSEEELKLNPLTRNEIEQICKEKGLTLANGLLTNNSVVQLIIEIKNHIHKLSPENLEESLMVISNDYKWYSYVVNEKQREAIQIELEEAIKEAQDLPF